MSTFKAEKRKRGVLLFVGLFVFAWWFHCVRLLRVVSWHVITCMELGFGKVSRVSGSGISG